MNTKAITLHFPEKIAQAIEFHAKVTNNDVSDIVIQALKQLPEFSSSEFLSNTITEYLETHQLNEVSQLKLKMEELEKKVDTLTAQLAELNQPTLLDKSTIQRITALKEYLLNQNIEISNFPQLDSIVQPQIADALPSYYVQIDNFFTPQECEQLFQYVWQQESAFVTTSIASSEVDYRRSIALYSFPEFSELITNKIQAILPDIFSKLALSPFTTSQIESQLTAHNDGSYYKIHNDNGSPDTNNREVTYVYYFYREPKPFSGGELLIYDSKVENNFYVAAESFKTIEPRNNSIVFFLSRYMHEVLPVNCPSRAFIDSRFTINGWIRS